MDRAEHSAAETCVQCGFDAADYDHADLLGTVRALAPMWRTMTETVDESVLAMRPAAGVWSGIEYAAHSRDVAGTMGYLAHLALTQDQPVIPGPVPEPPLPDVPTSHAVAVDELEHNAARLHKKVARITEAEWARRITLADDTRDVAWLVAHAVHDVSHHLRDVGRGLHALGHGAPRQHGSLVQVNASDGGVPKTALPSAMVDRRGIVGDRQAERRHHGRPFQALSLWSQDVIDALRAGGHPVVAGAAGENLTVAGIDWATIRPGVRIQIGEVHAEISAYATPCVKNAQWFADRDFRRIDHDLHPGLSRAYAWVLSGGTVAPGDPVIVEP
jgi:hypothetical protein